MITLKLPEELIIEILIYSTRRYNFLYYVEKYTKRKGRRIPQKPIASNNPIDFFLLNKRFLELLAPIFFPQNYYVSLPLKSTKNLRKFKDFDDYINRTLYEEAGSTDLVCPSEIVSRGRPDKTNQLSYSIAYPLWDYHERYKLSQERDYEVLPFEGYGYCNEFYEFPVFGMADCVLNFCERIMNNENSIMKRYVKSFTVDLMFLDEFQTSRISNGTLLGSVLQKYYPNGHGYISIRPTPFKAFSNYFPSSLLYTKDPAERLLQLQRRSKPKPKLPTKAHFQFQSYISYLSALILKIITILFIPLTCWFRDYEVNEDLNNDDIKSDDNIANDKDETEIKETDDKKIFNLKVAERLSYIKRLLTRDLNDLDRVTLLNKKIEWDEYKQAIFWSCFQNFFADRKRHDVSKCTSKPELKAQLNEVFKRFEVQNNLRIKRRAIFEMPGGGYLNIPADQFECLKNCHEAYRDTYKEDFFATMEEKESLREKSFLDKEKAKKLVDQLVKATTVNSSKHIDTSFIAFSMKNSGKSERIEGYENFKPKMIVINKPAESEPELTVDKYLEKMANLGS